jgi:transposase
LATLRTGPDAKNNPVAKAINYLFENSHWPAFTRFLTDGHACLTNKAAERSLRGNILGRKAWLFAGSNCGGNRATFMYSLIATAKMNNIAPQAWLADVLARMPALTVWLRREGGGNLTVA